MPKLHCTGCGYRFDLREDKSVPKRCPYCSREGTIGRAKLMQEWIDEVDQMQSGLFNR